jgi:hypothetical protein
MTLSDSEVIFWNKIKRDPFFMYVDNSIELVDKYWVDYNRKVLSSEEKSTVSNEDEIIKTDNVDYAYHVVES